MDAADDTNSEKVVQFKKMKNKKAPGVLDSSLEFIAANREEGIQMEVQVCDRVLSR